MNNFENSLQGKNTSKLNKWNPNYFNKLLDYQEWLKDKNFTLETIKNYLDTIKQYSTTKNVIDTHSISSFLRENLNKYEQPL